MMKFSPYFLFFSFCGLLASIFLIVLKASRGEAFSYHLDFHAREKDIQKEGKRRIMEEAEERSRIARETCEKEEKRKKYEERQKYEEEKQRRLEEKAKESKEKNKYLYQNSLRKPTSSDVG